MSEVEKLILQSVDKDIAEYFTGCESGTFALPLPMQIHICRHLKKISECLALKRKEGSGFIGIGNRG